VWYPADLDPAVLDAAARRDAVTAYLRGAARTAEVICLQEVQDTEWPALLEAAGPAFTGRFAVNDRSFWSEWVVPELGWRPNGTAVLIRRDAFRDVRLDDVAIGSQGNHSAMATAVHRGTGRLVRVASVHLDTDKQADRTRELAPVPQRWPAREASSDVVCGDFNEDTTVGTASGRLLRAGFTDVLAAVGQRVPTHPFRESYNGSPRWGIIDHVVVRGAAPADGRVVDAGVSGIDDEVTRIEEFMRRLGSDHYAVEATVELVR
jgi:endonuclease/exonuclease/phosphatase family metal-dependent hydrolase